MAIINESGLYSLVLSSKLPTAKKFKRWVTAEVLPSIRCEWGSGGVKFVAHLLHTRYKMQQKSITRKSTQSAENLEIAGICSTL